MFNVKKTTEQLIYERTCQDEFEKFAANSSTKPVAKEYAEGFPAFSMNRLVYSLTYNDMIAKLSKKYHGTGGGQILGYSNADYDRQIDIAQYIDLVKIGEHNFSFKEAMDIIRSVREDIGPDIFYGAVIANKTHVDVNPLHPLVLQEFMKFTAEELVSHGLTDYTVIIYTFKDTIANLKADYPEKFEIEDSYPADVINLVAGTQFKQERFSFIQKPELKLVKDKYQIQYKEVITDINKNEVFINTKDETNKYKQSYVVPGQILNLNGMTYPYYGAIYIKGGRAWNLTPMLATNINNPQELGTNGWKEGSQICTKVGDARTAEGCKTLNHSNTTSQRNPYTFRDGAMGYAKVAVDISLSTLYNDYNPTKHIIEYKKLTLDEFLEENEGSTKKDYFNYLKKRLKGKKV